MPTRSAPKNVRIGLRVTEEQHAILRAASRAEGTTITDFVLRHATRAAEEVLAGRRRFTLSEREWRAFTDALDRPVEEKPRLRRLRTEDPPGHS